MPAVKAGDIIGLLAGSGGHMLGRHQAATQQGLLVFTVQLENFHDLILKHLKQAFYLGITSALFWIALLPCQSPFSEVIKRRIEAAKQVFSAAKELKGLVIPGAVQGLVVAGDQTQKVLANNGEDAQFTFQDRNKRGRRDVVHGAVVGGGRPVTADWWASRFAASALFSHWT